MADCDAHGLFGLGTKYDPRLPGYVDDDGVMHVNPNFQPDKCFAHTREAGMLAFCSKPWPHNGEKHGNPNLLRREW